MDGTRYEVPVAAFDIPDSRVFPDSIVGLASSRPPNLQGWAYVWMTELARTFLGNDDTGAIVHETGHHLGLSHPHDAYDAGFGSNVFQGVPQGAFWFMRSGDESNTTMSYLPNTSEFGQFDRDNMARWQIAARLDNANRILGDVARSPKASRAVAQVVAADAKAGQHLRLSKRGTSPVRAKPRRTPTTSSSMQPRRRTSASSRGPASPIKKAVAACSGRRRTHESSCSLRRSRHSPDRAPHRTGRDRVAFGGG